MEKITEEKVKEIANAKDQRVESLFLSEADFKGLANPSTYELDKKEENAELIEAYRNLIDILKKYCDWKEEYYKIVSLWIIGTYFHNEFPSFPYLFLNAMRGSGKSRALSLITTLSKRGSLLGSLTEAVMFRTKGTLGIDEFEGLERKGKESLRELLNSAYKSGLTIKRMKKVKTLFGEEMQVEEFDVYRPIIMANISGMESVLGDRCITLTIEKSFNKKVVNLIEIFRKEKIVLDTKKLLNSCRLCRCRFSGETIQVYEQWNNFILHNNTNNTNNTNDTNDTNDIIPLLKGLNLTSLTGRELELSFPLLLIAAEISDNLLKETTGILTQIFSEKKEEEMIENSDISLIDFISQELSNSEQYFQKIGDILERFKIFIDYHSVEKNDWCNSYWLGRALKRLNLIIEKRRKENGREVRLNIKHAQEKIKQFK